MAAKLSSGGARRFPTDEKCQRILWQKDFHQLEPFIRWKMNVRHPLWMKFALGALASRQ